MLIAITKFRLEMVQEIGLLNRKNSDAVYHLFSSGDISSISTAVSLLDDFGVRYFLIYDKPTSISLIDRSVICGDVEYIGYDHIIGREW